MRGVTIGHSPHVHLYADELPLTNGARIQIWVVRLYQIEMETQKAHKGSYEIKT